MFTTGNKMGNKKRDLKIKTVRMWERKNFDRYLRENSKIRSVGFTPQIVKYRVVRSWMDT